MSAVHRPLHGVAAVGVVLLAACSSQTVAELDADLTWREATSSGVLSITSGATAMFAPTQQVWLRDETGAMRVDLGLELRATQDVIHAWLTDSERNVEVRLRRWAWPWVELTRIEAQAGPPRPAVPAPIVEDRSDRQY